MNVQLNQTVICLGKQLAMESTDHFTYILTYKYYAICAFVNLASDEIIR